MESTPLTSVHTVEAALRRAWSLWTCDPADQPDWSECNPAWGQCASTALVVQDLLGGTLRIANVHSANGSTSGIHFWNTLPGGLELDLTREQFRGGETIGISREIARPVDLARGRLPGNYRLLSMRVHRELRGEALGSQSRPVSVKGVCVDDAGRVLLCRNHRGEWELPGGRPDTGGLFPETLVREVYEETGLCVKVDRLIDATELEVQPGGWVDVLAYACDRTRGDPAHRATISAEHTALAFRHPSECPADELPDVYRMISGVSRRRTLRVLHDDEGRVVHQSV